MSLGVYFTGNGLFLYVIAYPAQKDVRLELIDEVSQNELKCSPTYLLAEL